MDHINIPPGTEPDQAIRILEASMNHLIDEVANKAPGRWTREDVQEMGRQVSKQLAQDVRRQERPWRP